MSYKIKLPDNYYRLLKDNAYILEKLGYSIAFFDELCNVEICDLSEIENQLCICICEENLEEFLDDIFNNQNKVLVVFSGGKMNIVYNGVRIIIDKLGDEKQRVMLKFGVDGIFFQFEMNDVFQYCDSKEDAVKHWPIKELTACVNNWNSFPSLDIESFSKSVSIWQYHDFAKIRIMRTSNKKIGKNANKKVDFEDASTEYYVAELLDVFNIAGFVVSSKMQRFKNVVDILIRIFIERMFFEYETYYETYLENYRDFLNNHKLEVLSEFNEKIYELVLEVYKKIAKAESMRADEIQTTDEQIEQVENLLASYQQNGGTQLLKNNQSTDT